MYPSIPPKIEKIVVKIPKKSHLYLFVKVIGIKNISGGMGIIIDSKKENIKYKLFHIMLKKFLFF